MKKLIVAAIIAGMAIASHAAQVKWVTAGNLTGVNVSAVTDNGNYAAGGSDLKSNSSITFSWYVYETGTDTLVDSLEDTTVKYATGKKTVAYNWAATANVLELNTTYDYKIIVTGSQNDLRALGEKGGFDYTASTIRGEVSGTFTTASSGMTTLTADIASWTVAGIVPLSPGPVTPEPTSGVLMLLGMAGLALRRKRA